MSNSGSLADLLLGGAGGGTRAQKKASSTDGVAVKLSGADVAAGIAKPQTTTPAGGLDQLLAAPLGLSGPDPFGLNNAIPVPQKAGGKHQQNDPAPIYKPNFAPGHAAVVHQNMSVGYIEALNSADIIGNPMSYRFVFHYNPSKITWSSGVTDATTAQMVLQPSTATGRSITDVSGAFGLTFLIDRSIEVRSRRSAANTGPTGSKEFAKMGTMYDIEFLYRVFNGTPKRNGPYVSPYGPNSSIYGFIAPNRVKVYLGPAMVFYGLPQGINIDHWFYTPQMIPMVSEVSLDFTNALAGGASADGVNKGSDKKASAKQDKTATANKRYAASRTPFTNGFRGR